MLPKLFQFFVPPSFTITEELHRKAKINVGTFIIVALFSIIYTTISYIISFKGGAISQIQLLIVSSFSLFLFKKNVPLNIIHILFEGSSILSIAIVMYYTKGYESFITPWLAAIPFVSLLISGKKGGLIALIACILTVGFFYYLHIQSFSFPEEYNLTYKNDFSFTTSVGLILILFVIGNVFENTKNTAFNSLKIKNKLLDLEKQKVEEKQKEILDSINYAKKIQESILPSSNEIKKILKNSFVLYKPKDIVSGDFYWIAKWENKILFAAVDCTGHGVPGAFVSIVGQNILNQTVNEQGITQPNFILNSLNKGVSNSLNHNNIEQEIQDGMDIAFCCYDTEELKLEYSGAYNPLWICRNNNIIEVKGDKFPIGSHIHQDVKSFNNHEIQLQKGDTIYIFTDGYADQFGGPKNKKFGYKNLKELLCIINKEPLDIQRELLESTIEKWKIAGNEEQLDDILIIGMKV